MPIAIDLLDRLQNLQSSRYTWEKVWGDIAAYTLPMSERVYRGGWSEKRASVNSLALGPISNERGKVIYDSTSVWAIDRLSAGMESLTVPQSEQWHSLQKSGLFAPKSTDIEVEWMERTSGYLFDARYNPRSGFAINNQRAIRSCCALGTGILFIEELLGRGAELPFGYRFLPIGECYLDDDANGNTDTNFRILSYKARVAVTKFGADNVSAKVLAAANDPRKQDDVFEFLHATCPRKEKGSSRSGGMRDSGYASYTVEIESKHMIGDSGFAEFPFVVYNWHKSADSPYGESPVMLALAEIKGMNSLAKDELLAAQQWVRPPTASADDGVTRPNLNPGAHNPGMMNDQGQLLIAPIITAQRPDFATAVMEQRRNSLREMLYVNLWQILIENPQMTATEAMIRANEKGELLGPAGASIQAGLANMVDREIGIMMRKGAFDPGLAMEPPPTMAGESIGVSFRSPLDRMRRMQQLVGMQRTVEFASLLAAAGKTRALDRLDEDTMIKLTREITGAPAEMLYNDDEFKEIVEQREQKEQAAQMIAAAQTGGDAAKAVGEGADAMAGSAGMRGMLSAVTGGAAGQTPQQGQPPA